MINFMYVMNTVMFLLLIKYSHATISVF